MCPCDKQSVLQTARHDMRPSPHTNSSHNQQAVVHVIRCTILCLSRQATIPILHVFRQTPFSQEQAEVTNACPLRLSSGLHSELG